MWFNLIVVVKPCYLWFTKLILKEAKNKKIRNCHESIFLMKMQIYPYPNLPSENLFSSFYIFRFWEYIQWKYRYDLYQDLPLKLYTINYQYPCQNISIQMIYANMLIISMSICCTCTMYQCLPKDHNKSMYHVIKTKTVWFSSCFNIPRYKPPSIFDFVLLLVIIS